MSKSYEIKAKETVKRFVNAKQITSYIGKFLEVNENGWITKASKYANAWGNNQNGQILWYEVPVLERDDYEWDDAILIRFSEDEYFTGIVCPKPEYINWTSEYLPSEIENFICKEAMIKYILRTYDENTTKAEWKELFEQYS